MRYFAEQELTKVFYQTRSHGERGEAEPQPKAAKDSEAFKHGVTEFTERHGENFSLRAFSVCSVSPR